MTYKVYWLLFASVSQFHVKGNGNCSRRKTEVDYSADYTVKSDEWAEKRAELTKQFASAKKNKFQEAATRRQINQVW